MPLASKDWWNLAGEVLALGPGSLGGNARPRRLRELSERTSTDVRMLLRMANARTYVVERCGDDLAAALRGLPLSHVDVLAKADVVDRDATGLQAGLLASAPADWTYRRLLGWYDGVKSAAMAANADRAEPLPPKQMAAAYKADCLRLLRAGSLDGSYSAMHDMPSPTTYARWRRSQPLVSFDHVGHVGVARKDGRDTDAYQCSSPNAGEASGATLDRVIMAVSLSSWVRCLWLLVGGGHGEAHADLVRRLGPVNVGVADVDVASGTMKPILLPSGSPLPDRRPSLNDRDPLPAHKRTTVVAA